MLLRPSCLLPVSLLPPHLPAPLERGSRKLAFPSSTPERTPAPQVHFPVFFFWRRGAQSQSQRVGKHGSDLINRQETSEAIREEKNIYYLLEFTMQR